MESVNSKRRRRAANVSARIRMAKRRNVLMKVGSVGVNLFTNVMGV